MSWWGGNKKKNTPCIYFFAIFKTKTPILKHAFWINLIIFGFITFEFYLLEEWAGAEPLSLKSL